MTRGIPAVQVRALESARASAEVTPDDDNDLSPIPRGVHCNGAGDAVGYLENDDTEGDARTFVMVAGMTYPYRFRRVMEDTDAVLVALY